MTAAAISTAAPTRRSFNGRSTGAEYSDEHALRSAAGIRPEVHADTLGPSRPRLPSNQSSTAATMRKEPKPRTRSLTLAVRCASAHASATVATVAITLAAVLD